MSQAPGLQPRAVSPVNTPTGLRYPNGQALQRLPSLRDIPRLPYAEPPRPSNIAPVRQPLNLGPRPVSIGPVRVPPSLARGIPVGGALAGAGAAVAADLIFPEAVAPGTIPPGMRDAPFYNSTPRPSPSGNLDGYNPTDSAPTGVGVPVTWNVCSDLITNTGQFAGTGCVQVQGNSNDTFTQLREGSNGDYVLRHFDGSGQQVAVINRFNPGLSTISGLRWQIVPGTIGTPSGDPSTPPSGNPLPLDNHLPDIAPVGFPSPIGLPGVVPGSSPGGNPSPLGATSPRGNLDPLPSPLSSPASDPPPFADAGDIPGLLPPLLLPGNASPGASPRPGLAGNPAVRTPGSPSSGQQPINTTNPQYQPEPQRLPVTGPSPTCNNDPCMSTVMGRQAQQSEQLSNIERAINAGGQAIDLALLAVINNKLGDQLPNGGISGMLTRIQNFAAKAWEATRMQKVLDVLTFVAVLHNAAMLSVNLGQTLADVTSQALTIVGIKDEEGSPIDVGQVIGSQVNAWMTSILGADAWNGTKATWQKANRIVSTASNIVYSFRSIADSIREIGEWTAENTGRIGNALKRFRVVGERAYPWMPEKVQGADRWTARIRRVQEGTQTLEDATGSLGSVLGEVQNVQEEFQQITQAQNEFKQLLQSGTPRDRQDNDPVKNKQLSDLTASASAALNLPVDLNKGEPPVVP